MALSNEIERLISRKFGLKPIHGWGNSIDGALDHFCRDHEIDRSTALSRLAERPSLICGYLQHLTVDESYFMRHQAQLEQLAHYFQRRPAQGLKIWSAGCCRGEEPYSVLIAVDLCCGSQTARQMEIVANDINAAAISTAKKGQYRSWSLRSLAPDVKARYFEALSDDLFALRPGLRGRVSFQHASIQKLGPQMCLRSLDAILYRNVGIYLTDEQNLAIYSDFARALRPDGLLLLATTDPSPPHSLFVLRHAGLGIYGLRQAGRGKRRAAATAPPAPSSMGLPTTAVTGSSVHEPRSPSPEPFEEILGRARRYADTHQLEQAIATIEEMLVSHGPCAAAHILLGVIDLERNQPKTASAHFERALAVDPTNMLSRYWYAISLKSTGQVRQALRQLELVRDSLWQRGAPDLLEDGKTTVQELLNAIIETMRTIS